MHSYSAFFATIFCILLLASCGGGDTAPTNTDTHERVAKTETRPSNSSCLAPANGADTVSLLSNTDCFTDTAQQLVAEGVIPYTVNSVLWSDGESKGRYFAIPDGTQITLTVDESSIVASNGIENGDLDFPVGSVLIKHFFSGERIVETRLLMNHLNDGWVGYSYQWNDAQTEANLLTTAKQINTPVRHYFPSRPECMDCHTDAALVALGPDTLQLNYTLYYTDGSEENYLDALDRLGYFFIAPLPAYKNNRLYALGDNSASAEQKVRSYLHSNCSGCHRTGAPQGGFDMRYTSSFATVDVNVCGIDASEPSSPIGGKLIDPGNASNSTIYQRLASISSIQMPPIGRETTDPIAIELMEAWINSLSSCD